MVYDGKTIEELYAYVIALEDPEAYIQTMQDTAPQVLEDLVAYAQQMAEASFEEPETVEFTNAGPFMPPVSSEAAMRLSRSVNYAFPSNRMIQSTNDLLQNIAAGQNDGVYTTKTATDNKDGTYKIRMEAYTTGEVTSTTATVPADIILVLDQSGSMQYNFSGGSSDYDNSRQKALQDAVGEFIKTVQDKAKGMTPGTEHRIALVTFAGEAHKKSVFTSDYANLYRIVTGDDEDSLSKYPSGATNMGAGMEMAEGILANDTPPAGSRNKVVILFTDGVPTTSSDFNTGVADNAIAAARDMEDLGATIYSIGIFQGADPKELYGDAFRYTLPWHNDVPCDGTEDSIWGGSWLSSLIGDIRAIDIAAGNRFLNFVSSNFPSASNIGIQSGTYNPGGYFAASGEGYKITQNFNRDKTGYYLTANDASGLNNIFDSISENIEKPTVELGANAKVVDGIAPYFEAVSNRVELYESPYNGSSFGSETISSASAKINDNEVTVTGFDFDKNFVSENEKADGTFGKKLIIEFNVKPKDGFFGGNHVPTNTENSGIYTGDDLPVKLFDVPDVNVPIDYEIAAQDQTIYLGNKAKLDGLMVYADKGSVTEYYKPNGTNNAYVNIKYTLKQGNKTVATMEIPAGAASGTWSNPTAMEPALSDCTGYTLGCTVSPISRGSVSDKVCDTEKATVHVMMPKFKIQANDIWADFSTAVDLSKWALGGAGQAGEITGYKPSFEAGQWVDANKHQTVTVDGAIGTAPTLDDMSDFTFTFTKKADPNGDGSLSGLVCTTGEKDTDFKVALAKYKIHGTEFTVPAGTDPIYIQVAYPDNGDHFTVHTNRFDLTVTKTHNTPAEYGDQTFAFQLTGDSGLSVPFALGDRLGLNKTFKGLLCGKAYTVAEDGAWAWRYGTPGSKNVPAVTNETSRTAPKIADQDLTFNNTFNNHKWLSDGDSKSNVFGSKG